MSDLTKAERIRLIEKTMRECKQEVTKEAVAKQYRHETGKNMEDEDGR
jgi:hypothetical protein